MIRLGLCCLFREAPIRFRTTTLTYAKTLEDPFGYLCKLVEQNVNALKQALTFCHEHGIGCYRIVSTFLPLSTHENLGYHVSDLPQTILEGLKEAKTFAAESNIRITFHPDQFIVLNTPKAEVLAKSLRDIERHDELAQAVGGDVINVHGGGVYGDKIQALERLKAGIGWLSPAAHRLLTLENDDRCFTPSDLLPVCEELGIPFVYDVHHHRCLPDGLSIAEATTRALKTWNREPLFHISSPQSKEKPRSHHDYIDASDFPQEWLGLDPLTVEVEAKAKELAVLKLKRALTR